MFNFSPTPLKRSLFFIFTDIFLSICTLYFAYLLRFNFDIPVSFKNNFFNILFLILFLKISILFYFNIYKISWRYFSLYDVKKILLSHLIIYILFFIFYILFKDDLYPFARSIILIDFILSLVFITLLRFSKRMIIETNSSKLQQPTLIIGASNSIVSFLKDNEDFNPVAIVDDDRMLLGTYISNLKIVSSTEIESIVKYNNVKTVIISKTLDQNELLELYNLLTSYGVNKIKIVNQLSSTGESQKLEDLSVEDLLARHPKDLDTQKISSFVSNKTILISGAGGSIGSELVRQCIKFNAKKILLLDNSEYNLYTILEELKDSSIELIPIMKSVVNTDLVEDSFKKYSPEVVIHAAAYKHVPLVEANIKEAINNNIIGTKNIIDISIKYGVKKFVMISTDKAVRPTNVMGTTKRVCELYAQNVDCKGTEIVSVRFGNVLGSSGSVIPKFKEQINNGGPITVTDPAMTRYFMLIPEACELVLQAASIGKGGELFILDMGEPVKIVDLAKKMIELSGRDDVKIEFSGMRPGEKLFEELLINDTDMKTEYESITVAKPTFYDIKKLEQDISRLLKSENQLEILKEIVPEFNHNKN